MDDITYSAYFQNVLTRGGHIDIDTFLKNDGKEVFNAAIVGCDD